LYGQSFTDLESNFRQPPASARPKTYWFWMNGNVSREGITLDLEAMKRVGIGGVMMFDGGTYLPKGPAGYPGRRRWRAPGGSFQRDSSQGPAHIDPIFPD
jgi:hypothetical protein